MEQVYLAIVLAPLAGAMVAGFGGRLIGRSGAHRVTIIGVGISALLSMYAYKHLMFDGGEVYNAEVYTWLKLGELHFSVGFLVDQLSVTMMVVVSFVSWMIHVYTIGYMRDDPGYQRFFSYISLFTFAMLMLVMSNNFVQLFFGWEAVGLVSYLLIGFWFKRASATFAALKAFLVNRVGDFGFLIGIAAVFMYFNSLDYLQVFSQAPALEQASFSPVPGVEWSALSFICICLFIGAMGKSAQVPLHVWLPDSMEGPTPISALIHAATMVTAGIFMVARMSPLYELSETALSLILFVGALTAFFMGLLGLVQHDIKRVIAYSTLSQLGYMTVALGASAYAVAIFHLVTHAFFKALLFLAAGSVIIALHHEQDLRKMGGLYRYMPVTWFTSLVGSLALVGFPLTSGFFSKDAIIEAVHYSQLPFAGVAYVAVLAAVFITALYSFRLFFLTFHGEERFDRHTWEQLREAPAVVCFPLLALAIPSLVIGAFLVAPMALGDYYQDALLVSAGHAAWFHEMTSHYSGAFDIFLNSYRQAPVWLSLAGIFVAWLCYLRFPRWPAKIADLFAVPHRLLVRKFYVDEIYQAVFVRGARHAGAALWQWGDARIIDGLLVNGAAQSVRRLSAFVRTLQTGYLYHYAFAMIIGLLLLLALFVHGLL